MGICSGSSIFVALLFLSLFPAASSERQSQELEKGRIIDKVVCVKNNQFSYALFLPSTYSGEREWPVIICFDPRAQGRRPVEKFQAAAETFGYILAGSLDSKNGPLEPSQKAAKAVWADIRERFSIDTGRIYTAGLSGGAEVAAIFPYFVETQVAGIISCGAGLPQRHEPGWVKPSSYFGIIGNWDFRYLDMARLEEPFDKVQVTHRIVYFDGWHQWPPEELMGESVEWMELMAMKSGLRNKDGRLIEAAYQKRMKNAADLESSGRLVSSVHEYESLASDFKDLVDVAKVEEKALAVKSSAKFRELEKDKRAAEEKELAFQPRVQHVFAVIEEPVSGQSPLRAKDIAKALEIDSWVAASIQTKSLFQSEAAKRVLSQVAVLADRQGFKARDGGDYRLAALCFELAAKASAGHPMNPGEYFNLACAFAIWGKEKDALKSLRLAVEKGVDDLGLLESDKDLDSLRATPQYAAIVEELKARRRFPALSSGIHPASAGGVSGSMSRGISFPRSMSSSSSTSWPCTR